MPFIPHTDDDVRDMLAAIGARRHGRAVRRDSGGAALPSAHRHSDGRVRDADRPPDGRARRPRRAAAQLHRRRRLRPPRSGGGVGDRDARRVLQRVHAVPGRGEPGHAAAAVRIPVDDDEPDRHGRVERLALRRRDRAGRGLPDGGACEPKVEVGAHPAAGRVEPPLSGDRAGGRRQPEPRVRAAALRRERRPDDGRQPRQVPRRGHHRAGDPAAELLRHARGRGRAHRPCARSWACS